MIKHPVRLSKPEHTRAREAQNLPASLDQRPADMTLPLIFKKVARPPSARCDLFLVPLDALVLLCCSPAFGR